MSSINEQTKIIEALYRLMDESAESGYFSATCRFNFSESDDGSKSVDTDFMYCIKGENISAPLKYNSDKKCRAIYLVPKLRDLMENHTGGLWSGFTIDINQNREVKTKFEYNK